MIPNLLSIGEQIDLLDGDTREYVLNTIRPALSSAVAISRERTIKELRETVKGLENAPVEFNPKTELHDVGIARVYKLSNLRIPEGEEDTCSIVDIDDNYWAKRCSEETTVFCGR